MGLQFSSRRGHTSAGQAHLSRSWGAMVRVPPKSVWDSGRGCYVPQNRAPVLLRIWPATILCVVSKSIPQELLEPNPRALG
jgi:hypothetical protein